MVETPAELPFIGDQVVCLSHDQAARSGPAERGSGLQLRQSRNGTSDVYAVAFNHSWDWRRIPLLARLRTSLTYSALARLNLQAFGRKKACIIKVCSRYGL